MSHNALHVEVELPSPGPRGAHVPDAVYRLQLPKQQMFMPNVHAQGVSLRAQ